MNWGQIFIIWASGLIPAFLIFVVATIFTRNINSRHAATNALIEDAFAAALWPVAIIFLAVAMANAGLSSLVLKMSLRVQAKKDAKNKLEENHDIFNEAPWGDYEDIHYEAHK